MCCPTPPFKADVKVSLQDSCNCCNRAICSCGWLCCVRKCKTPREKKAKGQEEGVYNAEVSNRSIQVESDSPKIISKVDELYIYIVQKEGKKHV